MADEPMHWRVSQASTAGVQASRTGLRGTSLLAGFDSHHNLFARERLRNLDEKHTNHEILHNSNRGRVIGDEERRERIRGATIIVRVKYKKGIAKRRRALDRSTECNVSDRTERDIAVTDR